MVRLRMLRRTRAKRAEAEPPQPEEGPAVPPAQGPRPEPRSAEPFEPEAVPELKPEAVLRPAESELRRRDDVAEQVRLAAHVAARAAEDQAVEEILALEEDLEGERRESAARIGRLQAQLADAERRARDAEEELQRAGRGSAEGAPGSVDEIREAAARWLRERLDDVRAEVRRELAGQAEPERESARSRGAGQPAEADAVAEARREAAELRDEAAGLRAELERRELAADADRAEAELRRLQGELEHEREARARAAEESERRLEEVEGRAGEAAERVAAAERRLAEEAERMRLDAERREAEAAEGARREAAEEPERRIRAEAEPAPSSPDGGTEDAIRAAAAAWLRERVHEIRSSAAREAEEQNRIAVQQAVERTIAATERRAGGKPDSAE